MKITSRQKQASGAAFVTSGAVGDDVCVSCVPMPVPLSMPHPSKVKHGYNAKFISRGKTVLFTYCPKTFLRKFLGPIATAGRIISEFWVAKILPSV